MKVSSFSKKNPNNDPSEENESNDTHDSILRFSTRLHPFAQYTTRSISWSLTSIKRPSVRPSDRRTSKTRPDKCRWPCGGRHRVTIIITRDTVLLPSGLAVFVSHGRDKTIGRWSRAAAAGSVDGRCLRCIDCVGGSIVVKLLRFRQRHLFFHILNVVILGRADLGRGPRARGPRTRTSCVCARADSRIIFPAVEILFLYVARNI